MTIPPELLRSAPREVSISRQGRAVAAFAVGFVLLLIWLVWQDQTSAHPRKDMLPVSAIAVVYFVIGSLVKLYMVRREMGLLSNGRAVVATIQSPPKRLWLRDAKRPVYRVQCRFTTRSGGERSVTIKTRLHIAEGTEVVIVYDPDQTERAVLYPAPSLKVEGAA